MIQTNPARLLRGIAAGVIGFVLLGLLFDAVLVRVPEDLRMFVAWLPFVLGVASWAVLIWLRRRPAR